MALSRGMLPHTHEHEKKENLTIALEKAGLLGALTMV